MRVGWRAAMLGRRELRRGSRRRRGAPEGVVVRFYRTADRLSGHEARGGGSSRRAMTLGLRRARVRGASSKFGVRSRIQASAGGNPQSAPQTRSIPEITGVAFRAELLLG